MVQNKVRPFTCQRKFVFLSFFWAWILTFNLTFNLTFTPNSLTTVSCCYISLQILCIHSSDTVLAKFRTIYVYICKTSKNLSEIVQDKKITMRKLHILTLSVRKLTHSKIFVNNVNKFVRGIRNPNITLHSFVCWNQLIT